MKSKALSIILISIVGLAAPLSSQDIEFRVDPAIQYEEIRPVWDILNLWSPSFLLNPDGTPNTWYRDTHPFVNRVILMTATGGRPGYPQLEILKTDSSGNIFYDFTNFDKYLEAARFNGYTPIIVLGAIPVALAPENYHIGAFGSITDPPADYMKWYDFVKMMINHCVDKFGNDEVKKWSWRLYTEPDNYDWWRGTREEYFKFYDYTVSAAQEALMDISIGPGNMLGEIEDNWGIEFIDHAFAGTNYFTQEQGSHLDFFTISAYESVGDHPPLGRFEKRVETIKNKLIQYDAQDNVALGFAEGQLIFDENRIYLWLGDGTEYGASWQAAYHILGIREGFDRIVQWGFSADGVKTPKYNVIEMLEKMKGDIRMAMQVVRDNRNILARSFHKIDGIASMDTNQSSLKVLIYSHYMYRNNIEEYIKDLLPVKINFQQLPFQTSRVLLKHWVVDSTHSNFFNTWLEDSKHLQRFPANGIGGSTYDADIRTNLNQDGREFWQLKKPAYLDNDDLEKISPDTSLNIQPDGSLDITINMRPHQVSLLELTPYPVTSTGSDQTVFDDPSDPVQVFPNPSGGRIYLRISQGKIVDEIRIFNLNGQLIKSFNIVSTDPDKPVTLTWNGDANNGRQVPSGNYVAVFVLDDGTIIRKLTLLR